MNPEKNSSQRGFRQSVMDIGMDVVCALELLRKELRTEFSVILKKGLAKIDARMREAIESCQLLNGGHIDNNNDDDDDDEEMGPSAEFINDVPSVSGSSSDSSDDEIDKMEEEEEEEDEEEDDQPPKKKSKTKAKLAPVVHYKMKPRVGKRVRKAPRRYSPSRKSSSSSFESAEPSESLSDSGGGGGGGGDRTDREHWNVVCQLTAAQRLRNPWYSRKVGGVLNQIRSALGREGPKNQGPRDLWDDIGRDPEAVQISPLAAIRQTTCAFCGGTKPCKYRIWLGEERDGGYVGSSCVGLVKAWCNMAHALETAGHGEWHLIQAALDELQSAHAGKSERNH
jgi:hypothetical protein